MDAVSYAHSAKQAQRIAKFIENPDSTSGIVTTPKVIEAGETVTIPAGRMAVLPNLQIDGDLVIDGDVFVPSGATFGDLDADKMDKDINGLVDKTTPADADELVIADSASSFSLKKITWASIKTALSSLFIPKVSMPTTNALAKINANGAIKNSSIIEDENGNISIGSYNYWSHIQKDIPISGADYKHKYLLLTRVPTYGLDTVNISLRGLYLAERTNGYIGVNTDINFSIGYSNTISFTQNSKGNSNIPNLVQVIYSGYAYLALYWYSAPNSMVSKFVGEFFNFNLSSQTLVDSNFLTHYESDTAVHSSISYTGGSTSLTHTGNFLVGTTVDNGVDKLQVNGSISSGQISQISNGDLNNYVTRTQVIGTYPSGYVNNIPINDHGYLEVIVYNPNAYVMQRFTTLGATGVGTGRIFVRCLVDSVWSAWVEK